MYFAYIKNDANLWENKLEKILAHLVKFLLGRIGVLWLIFLAEKKQNVRVGPIHKYNYLAHRVVSNFPQYTWIYVSKIFVDLRRNLTDAHELVLLGIFQKKIRKLQKIEKFMQEHPQKWVDCIQSEWELLKYPQNLEEFHGTLTDAHRTLLKYYG